MLNVYYWNGRPNAGDYFTAWLLDKMNIEFKHSIRANLCITGSILNGSQTTNAKIWGCGFHNAEEKKKFDRKNIYAVRGKLTLHNLGFSDVVTGDPGILASYFYKSKSIKKYKFGIIPHYVDEDFFNSISIPSFVKVIKISTNNIDKLLDDINECEFILSSSLHGIIFAHSYHIPAMRIKVRELVSKHAFKFKDYYSNWNLKYLEKNIKTKSDLDWNEFDLLYKNKEMFVPSEDEILKNQNDLLSVFPFKNKLS